MADDTTPATTLEWYVQASGEDVQFVASCEVEAQALVDNFIGEGNPYGVPAPVVARAVLEVGADLFHRKASRNGVIGFDGEDAQPIRVNRDPMAAAYPILRPYLVIGL